MINASQYAQATQASAAAKKSGFELVVSGNNFILNPVSGFASLFFKEEPVIRYGDLENTMSFLRGWDAFAKQLTNQAGIDLSEVKSRIEQQRIADTLAGKRRRSVKI